MRDLTKSMLKLSWALPLFGVKQLTSLSLPTQVNQEETVRALDAVSAAAQHELGSTFQELYTTGDDLQRNVVDLVFNLLLLDALNPGQWLGSGARILDGPGPARPISSTPPAAPVRPSPPAGPHAPAGPAAPGWGPMRD